MNKRVTAAAVIMASFLIGSVLGWWLQAIRAEKERASTAVLDAVGVAGLCAAALEVGEEGRTATLQKILEMRMASALNTAAEQVGNASSPGLAIPNLIEGLNRARRYAVAKGMPEVVAKCDRVLQFLNKSNVSA